MIATAPELDLATIDFSNVLAGIDEIRALNPHRYEFEMLTAVVHIDPSRHVIVGYKDISDTEFWVRGHMPGFPLMPGVLMCEAAAVVQLLLQHRRLATRACCSGSAVLMKLASSGKSGPATAS